MEALLAGWGGADPIRPGTKTPGWPTCAPGWHRAHLARRICLLAEQQHSAVGLTHPSRVSDNGLASSIFAGCCTAAARPISLVLDDLRTDRQATVELLSYLANKLRRSRLLVVAALRPDVSPVWTTAATLVRRQALQIA